MTDYPDLPDGIEGSCEAQLRDEVEDLRQQLKRAEASIRQYAEALAVSHWLSNCVPPEPKVLQEPGTVNRDTCPRCKNLEVAHARWCPHRS